MYRLLRNTHPFLGIASFLFALMYRLSALQMAYNGWFSMKQCITEVQLTISKEESDDPRRSAQL
jgi:hypothetical protein